MGQSYFRDPASSKHGLAIGKELWLGVCKKPTTTKSLCEQDTLPHLKCRACSGACNLFYST
jgi:hypothetical protein